MLRTLRFIGLILMIAVAAPACAEEIAALVYHDITAKRTSDPYAVTLHDFERQMEYLVRHGYEPVSLHTLEAARQGRATLPKKPVLLTFDDGLRSYYERAYPVLRRYGFPSVVSVVTSWLDRRSIPDDDVQLMTWQQVRELARSPIVEIASHTDDLHRSVVANAWGTHMPAAVTRRYDVMAQDYESDAVHAARVKADLARSVERLREELGRLPVAIAWPYGEYDRTLVKAAADLGMLFHLTLDRDPTVLSGLPRINREMFRQYRGLGDLESMLSRRPQRNEQWRFVEVDIEQLALKDQAAREQRLSRLVNRLELLRVDAVLLNPFTADGKRAYFANPSVPATLDVLNEITYQILRRAGLKGVYLRVPLRQNSEAMYRDLARLNWFNGIVLDGAADRESLERVTAIFRHYKPALRVGTRPELVRSRADFVFVDAQAKEGDRLLARHVSELLKDHPQALIMLRRTPETSEGALRSAMQTLRAAGALHYGYGPDDFARNVPDLMHIVRPLTEHTIRGSGG